MSGFYDSYSTIFDNSLIQKETIMTNVTRMQEITNEIAIRLDNIQSESMEVGKLLKEALEEIKEQGGKQPDFVQYCKDNFAISKAQAYKLMKISETFGEDKRFVGVAMRVLYSLASQATEEEIEKAAEFAENGTLNTAIVNQLLNPVPAQPEVPTAPPVTEETELNEEQTNALNEALNNVVETPVTEEAPKTTAQIVESADEEMKLVLADKDKQIETLNTMLKTLQETVNKLEASTKVKPTAPFLPQFRNACPYAVLGLGQVEAKQKAKVTKAFRELIKCGYGDGHEAFELLVKAKDQLLADIEENNG